MEKNYLVFSLLTPPPNIREDMEKQSFEKHQELRRHILFAANNWTVDIENWNGLLEEINSVCYALEQTRTILNNALNSHDDMIEQIGLLKKENSRLHERIIEITRIPKTL